MSNKTVNAPVTVVGIDIGKNSFHVVGKDLTRRQCAATQVVAGPSWSALRQHPILAGVRRSIRQLAARSANPSRRSTSRNQLARLEVSPESCYV